MAVFLGIDFAETTSDEFLDIVRRGREQKLRVRVVTPNLNFVRMAEKDENFRLLINQFDYRYCDSQILYFLMKIFGKEIPEKLAGSDLTRLLFDYGNRENWKIALFGSSKKTMRHLERVHRSVVAAVSPPICEAPHELEENAVYVNQINTAKPDVLLVAMGAPKQEVWLNENWDQLDVPVAICVGAGLDFESGRITRAPRLFQKTGLEWFWRLCQEPGRLSGRYWGDSLFLIRKLPGLVMSSGNKN